jgi:glycosyltransferase involved in cell wall biosynthesis
VDQSDISNLAGRLIALLTDEKTRHAMGRAGRARVCTEHTYLRFRHRLLSIIVSANSQLTGAPRWN